MSRIHYKKYREITLRARGLRKNQTSQERVLWEVLRLKKFSGYRFLRQHPVFYQIDKGWVDYFIADFYCYKLKLIIELDGEIHLKQKDYDKERDEKLKAKGLQVIRIDNERIKDLDKLLTDLGEIFRKRADYLLTKNI